MEWFWRGKGEREIMLLYYDLKIRDVIKKCIANSDNTGYQV